MTEPSTRTGVRVIALLAVVLGCAILLVVWLTLQPDAAPPRKPAAPVAKPRVETPTPRPVREKPIETTAAEPPTQRPPVEAPPPETGDVETVKLDVAVFGESGGAAVGATVLLL